jgi:pyruvate formate lyase activating enzyme
VQPGSSHSESTRSEELAARRDGRLASIHSWELVTAVDGPGTRMTLFLSGCPLRCRYCHNPDTWKMRDGTATTLDDVLRRLERYRRIFEVTGGGLTISGGEPLLQSAFVTRLVAGARTRGIHTALDTSGNLGRRASDDLLDDLDLVFLDVKSGLPGTYQDVTSAELQPTIDFGDRLARAGVPVWVRFVLVPGLTDAPANVEAVADIVQGWPNVERVEVLPFHQLGAGKWERLGIDYTLEGARPPSAQLCERVAGQFRRRGLPVC